MNTMPKEETTNLPLSGVRILDLSRLLPGPLATMMLADLGAEVIKIEHPQKTDYIRNFPPFMGKDSAFYLSLNRNKKSLLLDVHSVQGKLVFMELVKKSDIVIEQFRPGVLDKLEIGYKHAQAVDKGIIYVSVSGYGQTGPYKDFAGHDLNYLALSGILSQFQDGGQVPAFQMADVAGAYMTVQACLAALLKRNNTKSGTHVDVSLMDACLPFLTLPYAHFTGNRKNSPNKLPFLLNGSLPNYNTYICKDGKKVALGALEPKFWSAFCSLIGKTEWCNSNLFDAKNREKISQELKQLFLQKTRDEWVAFAQNTDCCLSPVLALDELEDNAQIKARDSIINQKNNAGTVFSAFNYPLKFEHEISPLKPPPEAGQHTVEIMEKMGFSKTEIEKLKDSDVIVG